MFEIITGIRITLKDLIISYIEDVNDCTYRYFIKYNLMSYKLNFLEITKNCSNILPEFYFNLDTFINNCKCDKLVICECNQCRNMYEWIKNMFYDLHDLEELCYSISVNKNIDIFIQETSTSDLFNETYLILGYKSDPILDIISIKELCKYEDNRMENWLKNNKDKLIKNIKLSINMINIISQYVNYIYNYKIETFIV